MYFFAGLEVAFGCGSGAAGEDKASKVGVGEEAANADEPIKPNDRDL
jgi:hypothetical protein